ncbi:MAG: tetratricopeptide repeat protein, partial [Phycisphaerales bacterium]|nr:tetratricopeptide repeat protein [Phycisphaerales bacterium]
MAKARKQLNYRILLLMGTVVVVLLGVFLAATQLTSSLTPEEYIAKCDKALKKDPVDWSGAMGNLNSAIRATGDETFPGKLFLRGYQILSDQVKQDRSLSLADRQQRQGAAMRMLDRALERNAKYCPALIKKMEFYYPRFASNPKGYQPRIRDFITNMTTVLNSPEYQHNAKFYFQRGMANWYLRRLAGTGRGKEYAEAAIVDFNQAVIKASGDEATPEDKENEIPYRLELAKRYSDLGEEEKANAEYDKGIKANPTSASLYVGYSSYLRKQKKEAESLEQIKLAIEKGDNPALGYVELAVHHSIKQEYSQAEEALNNALKKDSAALVVYPSMARLQWIQNRPDAAFAWLRKGLVALREHVEKKDPNKKKVNARRWRRMLNYRLADYLLDVAIYARGDDQAKVPDLLAEAQECHTNLVQIYEKDPLQLIIAGKIAYVKKDWPEARRCLEEATKGGQRDLNTITTLSMVYQNLRLPSKAEKLVNAILAINVEIPNRVRFLLTAANFRIKAHDYLKALRLVNLALEADADNSDVHRFRRILAQALASDTTLIVPKSDDERNMVLLRAREMVLEERYEGAEKRLLMLREHDPKDTDSARLLLELYQRTNRKPKAQELLATLIEEDPTNESFQRMSEWLMADPERRVALQKEYAHALEDVPLRYLRLSDICTRANEAEKAKEWFNKAVKEYPEDQRVVKARIAKLLKDKEWASVAKLLDQIDNETDRKLATANLAKHQEKWGEAISIYKQVLEESPHWKAVRFLLGQCYFDSKDIPEAKKQYNWIVNEDNTHLAAMKELARIAQQEGQYDEFMTILREIRRYPHGRQDTEIDRWWTRRELDTKDRPAAITRREVIFRKAPNDASNILSLARLYEQEKDVPRAQAKYEYLYKTTENPMQYAQTLSLFY